MMVGEATAGFRLLGHRQDAREQRNGTKKSANQNPNTPSSAERSRIKADRPNVFRIVFQAFSSPEHYRSTAMPLEHPTRTEVARLCCNQPLTPCQRAAASPTPMSAIPQSSPT